MRRQKISERRPAVNADLIKQVSQEIKKIAPVEQTASTEMPKEAQRHVLTSTNQMLEKKNSYRNKFKLCIWEEEPTLSTPAQSPDNVHELNSNVDRQNTNKVSDESEKKSSTLTF